MSDLDPTRPDHDPSSPEGPAETGGAWTPETLVSPASPPDDPPVLEVDAVPVAEAGEAPAVDAAPEERISFIPRISGLPPEAPAVDAAPTEGPDDTIESVLAPEPAGPADAQSPTAPAEAIAASPASAAIPEPDTTDAAAAAEEHAPEASPVAELPGALEAAAPPLLAEVPDAGEAPAAGETEGTPETPDALRTPEAPGTPEGQEPHEAREAHAERAAANLAVLAAEIDRLAKLQGRAFWDHVKNVNALFRSLRPIVAEERRKLWDDFSARCEKARVERAEWNHLADQNARTLEAEIEALGIDHLEGTGARYVEFWDHTRRVREQFKALAPLRREDRRKLWERFKGVCAATRKRQNESMAGRKVHSHEMRASVEVMLAEARAAFETATETPQFNEIRALLNRAMETMRGTGKAPEDRMVRPDARACWEQYKELSTAVRRRMDALGDETYTTLRNQATEAATAAQTESPLAAQSRIRDLQLALRGAPLDKSRREEIRRILSEAWVAASHRIQEERDDRRRRRDEWVQRSEERIRGWEDLLRKNEGIIASLESQIEDLERQIEEAWNESWAERAKGWVEEKRIKVEDIRATNTDVAERIQSLRAKLPSR